MREAPYRCPSRGKRAAFVGVVLAAGMLPGCDPEGGAASPPRPRSAEASAHSAELKRSPAREQDTLTERVAFERHLVELRLRGDWELPSNPKDRPCPPLAKGDDAADTVILDVNDARPDGRQLLSLDLTAELTSSDLDALEPLYLPGTSAKARRELKSTRAAEEALSKLAALAERRYAAVFHVTHLTAPRFFHDPKKRLPEWSPGWMMGWLAIHELNEPEPLCQHRIDVRSDTSQASRERRLRESTQRALMRALARRFHDAGQRANERLGAGLSWPKARAEHASIAAAR